MSIGDLATILTVGGVSIYVLGLIGMAIPIRRVFTGDISTAWYAVSLVPKTVVAGQGVRIWMLWTVVSAVLPALLFLGIAVLRILLLLPPLKPEDIEDIIVVVSAATCLVVWGLFWRGHWEDIFGPARRRILALRRRRSLGILLTIWLRVRFGVRPGLVFQSLIVPLGVGQALLLISLAMISGQPQLVVGLEDWHIFYPEGSHPSVPSVFRGIVVLLVGSFFLGLPFAIWASPSLPKVRITQQPEGTKEGVADPLEGWLVAHSDGFWHLFPRLPTDEYEGHQEFIHRDLISIPDDKTVVVRTFGKEVSPAKSPSEADGQRDAEEACLETERGGETVSLPERPAPE